MRKILLTYSSLLTYSGFLIAFVAVTAVFTTATSFIHLAVATSLYLLLVYFAYKVLPNKLKWQHPSKKPATGIPSSVSSAVKSEAVKIESVGISDIDKRVFLKLIGGTSLFLFLYSIFNKTTESLFYKGLSTPGSFSLGGIGSNLNGSAPSQPLDGYRISEFDDNIVAYYGFINQDGAWYIMKVDTQNGSFRYAKGSSNFSENWVSRKNLQYDYFNSVFK